MARGAQGYTHRFDPLIQYWSDYYNLPSSRVLKAMLIHESSLDPEGSRQPNQAGAVGIGQFLPGTASEIQNPMTGGYGFDRTDPGQSIMASAQFFRRGLDQAGDSGITGDPALQFALRHYFAGDGMAQGRDAQTYPGVVADHYTKPYSEVLDAQGNETSPPVPGAAASAGRGQAISPAPATPPATIVDATQQAGFGHRFGDFQQPPQGMIIHHTGGRGDINGVIQTYQERNFPAQFVIDRNGTIFQTLPDGARGQHIRDGWGPFGAGKSNANMEGVEVIARDDKDVLPVQQRAAAALVGMRAQKWGYDPQSAVWGHGEVNPGHKEADEGLTIVSGIRNGTLPVPDSSSVNATAPPLVQLASAGFSDVVPGRSSVTQANVSDPSVRTPLGSTGPQAGADVGDDYWARAYPQGLPPVDRGPQGAAGPAMPWSVVGAPISNQLAPPSLYTASSPQQQQAWQTASTPLGYALMRQLAGQTPPGSALFPGPSPPDLEGQRARAFGALPGPPIDRLPPAMPPTVSVAGPPPPPPAPVIGTPLTPPLPSLPNATAPLPSNIAIPGPATAVPSGIGGAPSAPFIPVDYYNRFTVQPPSGVRNLSDDELSRLAPEDVLGTVSRSDLTMADRAALTARLSEMQGVSP